MPFLAVCPECHYAQVCVLPRDVFPRIKCCRCREIYDPIGTEDTEVIPALAGSTIARLVRERRANRAEARAARERKRRRRRRRARKLVAAGAVAAPRSAEAIAAAVLSEPLPVLAAAWVGQPRAAETAAVADEPTVPAEPRPIPARPIRRRRPSESDEVPESVVLCGWLAVTLAGISLTASQFPYGWWIALGLGSIGLVLGSNAVRRFASPLTAASAGINVVVLLVLQLAPSWLGVRPGRLIGERAEQTGPVAVGRNNTVASVADGWVDMAQSAWQWDDVRVSGSRPTVSVARLRAPGGETKQTGRQFLTVRIHIQNEGVARDIPVPTWDAVGQQSPRLTSESGIQMPPAAFEVGWTPARPARTMLGPGQAADCLLYFELPADMVGRCRLELPGAPLGVPVAVRLLLP